MRKLILTIGFLICVSSIFAQTDITTGMSGAQVRSALNVNFDSIYGLTKRTTSSTRGVIYRDGVRFIHDYPGTNWGSSVGLPYGGKNLFMGRYAGNFTMTGAMNVAVGDSSFYHVTSGSLNTAIGAQAGLKLTTGHASTFLGRATGKFNTTGTDNTFIGESAGERNISGNYNTYVGVNAGMYIMGSFNVAIGENSMFGGDWEAGGWADTCEFNTAIGAALSNIRSGNYNCAMGISAGAGITTGSNNILIGLSAAGSGNSSSNVMIGDGAGYSTTGSYNTYLGHGSGNRIVAGTNNVFLGYQSGSRETGSNKLFIDNQDRTNEANARITSLIYGVFDAAPVNQKVTINGLLKLLPLADPPAGAVLGDIYADTDTHLYFYNGTTWKQLDN